MDNETKYFENALSDFMYDMASGGAIRHLVDKGFSVEQIMQELDFPTPKERVEKTVYKYMIDSHMLLDKLPIKETVMKTTELSNIDVGKIFHTLRNHININGQENSYVLCPFGELIESNPSKLSEILACLNSREREYLLGIQWKTQIMYHRLNDRMLNIGVQVAIYSDLNLKFYFLEEQHMFVVSK